MNRRIIGQLCYRVKFDWNQKKKTNKITLTTFLREYIVSVRWRWFLYFHSTGDDEDFVTSKLKGDEPNIVDPGTGYSKL